MIEKILFNLLAFSLFIIIFFKIIRKNDANYIILLILEAIGVLISFVVIKLRIEENVFWSSLRYILSVIIPIIIIIIEAKGINFSEILSVFLAKFFIMIGDNKLAKAILIKLVTKYPESYFGHKILAEIYEKEGGMRRAIDEYVTSVDIRKNDYKSYFKIADLLKELGKKDEAIEMLNNLVKNKPDCYEASVLLGELLCEQERFKEAANVYHEALKFRPADYDLYYNLGIVYTRLSDFQMAKEMYEKAAEINHRLYGAYYNLGQIAFIQKDLETAEKYFKNSLYGDLEAMSYYQLAKIYAFKGEKDKAINFLNKAIELEPKLLEKASHEKYFEKIKEYITVSVKMDKQEETENRDMEIDEEEAEETRRVLEIQEIIAREYLEEVTSLIENMNESASKQKIEEKINMIFEKERKDKKVEEKEKVIDTKEERPKELGTN